MRESTARAASGRPRPGAPRREGRRCGRVRCRRSCPASLGVVAPTGADGWYTVAARLLRARSLSLLTTSRLCYVRDRKVAHAGKDLGMAYRDQAAQRASERRCYARNRDKILARRRAQKAAKTPEERQRDSERRRARTKRPRRADLSAERLELVRARDRGRKRPKTDGQRAAAREATRRWRQRNSSQYAPRRRQLDRERYAANRESVLAAKRQQYAADPTFAERFRARNRASYKRNQDRRRESHRRYYVEHGDELRARQRERSRQKYAANPRAALDYYKQWRLQNLERARAYVRVSGNKRRAAAAGAHFTFKEWEELLGSHDGRCAYCGSTERIEADHRIPLCRGGSNEISNILPACRQCNRRKHRKTEEEFRTLLKRQTTVRVEN
jgi:5-methylcytosine-specific restriction endonuclease McrA